MNQKQMLPIIILAALSLVLTGCGKLSSGKITGPGSNGAPPVSATFDLKLPVNPTPSMARLASPAAAAIDIGVGPAVGDSVFISGILADPLGDPKTSWQARKFAGLLLANGSLDRPFVVVVPNEQRDYEFAMSFKHEKITYQYLGPVSVNGVPLSAWNYTKYVIWRVFRFKPGSVIDPIRDDAPNMMWTECQITGIVHPDSLQLNQPVSGGEPLWFLSTDTRLDSNLGIFVETPAPSSWRFPVFAKKGETFLIRANRELGFVDGQPILGPMYLPGVFLKNADGSLTQLQNLFNLSSDPNNSYYVFEATLGMDGKWVNPRPNIDERFGRIIIGG